MTPVFQSIFPYTQKVVGEYPLMNDAAINKAITLSTIAFEHWKKQRFEHRSVVLKKATEILRTNKIEYATLISNEMGKVFTEALGEVEKCTTVCDYYAENAKAFLNDEMIEAGFHKSFMAFEPIGAVFAVMPWNFPFWQVFRFAAPALMAGNVAFLKHAPNVSGCALAIEKIFREAGLPEGAFQSLVIDIPQIEKFVSADIVQAVTLTGSEKAGSSMAALAAKYIKKSVLELGGSDALIVLPDADIKQAAAVAVQSRMLNAGQSCIGSKRFIVIDKVYDDFVNEVQSQIQLLKQGNPFESGITTGPLARLDLATNLENQMKATLSQGASLGIGGNIDGCNFSPSLLLNVTKGMTTFEEEAFGPLASIIKSKNEVEAIELANASPFGLGGSIWTKDIEKGVALARKIYTGAVFINSLVKSDARLPFGGVKRSGYGRELGKQGIMEFVNAKTIAVNLSQ